MVDTCDAIDFFCRISDEIPKGLGMCPTSENYSIFICFKKCIALWTKYRTMCLSCD